MWEICEHCGLTTTELVRHQQVAHQIRQSRKLRKPDPEPKLPIGKCFYCNEWEPMTSDHVIPMRLGKNFNRAWNRVPACRWCNQKKGGLLLSEWWDKIMTGLDHPKYMRIAERQEIIVYQLFEREDLRKYPTWIKPR